VTDDDYKRALENAHTELADLLAQKAGIEDRIVKLRETIVALSKLVGDDLEGSPILSGVSAHLSPHLLSNLVSLADVGLTDAVRSVLQKSREHEPLKFLFPTDVRDRLKAANFDLKYRNEMAAITTVLYRLDELGKLDKGKAVGSEKIAYRWKVSGESVPGTEWPIRELSREGNILTRKQLRLQKERLAQERAASYLQGPPKRNRFQELAEGANKKGSNMPPPQRRPTYQPVSMVDDEGKPKKVSD